MNVATWESARLRSFSLETFSLIARRIPSAMNTARDASRDRVTVDST